MTAGQFPPGERTRLACRRWRPRHRELCRQHREFLLQQEDCFGETPKPTRETRALPGIQITTTLIARYSNSSPVSRSKASTYLAEVLSITSRGNFGPGGL